MYSTTAPSNPSGAGKNKFDDVDMVYFSPFGTVRILVKRCPALSIHVLFCTCYNFSCFLFCFYQINGDVKDAGEGQQAAARIFSLVGKKYTCI